MVAMVNFAIYISPQFFKKWKKKWSSTMAHFATGKSRPCFQKLGWLLSWEELKVRCCNAKITTIKMVFIAVISLGGGAN